MTLEGYVQKDPEGFSAKRGIINKQCLLKENKEAVLGFASICHFYTREHHLWDSGNKASQKNTELTLNFIKRKEKESPGGPVVKTSFQCRGCGFDPWLGGLRSHMPKNKKQKLNKKNFFLIFLKEKTGSTYHWTYILFHLLHTTQCKCVLMSLFYRQEDEGSEMPANSSWDP